MLRLYAILVSLVGILFASTETRRATLENADTEIKTQLSKYLSYSEISLLENYANNLSSDHALAVMGVGFNYKGLDGYQAFLELTPSQRLYAVMFFAEMFVKNYQGSSALMIKSNIYQQYLYCSSSLAGTLSYVDLPSAQKVLQSEKEEEARIAEAERIQRQKDEETQRRLALMNDSLYVYKQIQFAKIKYKEPKRQWAKLSDVEYTSLKEAVQICRNRSWSIPYEISSIISKYESNKLNRASSQGFWEDNFPLIFLGGVAVLGISLLLLLSSIEN